MIFTDVDNFWIMYDKIKIIENENERIKLIKNEYFKNGTKGLRLLIKKDKLTSKNFSDFLKDTVFYNSIRNTTLLVKKDTSKIRNKMKSFERMYPKAKFSNIYFSVGQFYHGGIIIDKNIIIEIQNNVRTDSTKSSFLFYENQMNKLNNYSSLTDLLIHELVHISQVNTKTNSLLSKTITEGAADFIMYLQTKNYPSSIKETYEYGNLNERALWLKFQEDLKKEYKEIKRDWFYNYSRNDILPDLGYFMGFKICENYYNLTTNKTKAIEFILDGKNSEKLLETYKKGK